MKAITGIGNGILGIAILTVVFIICGPSILGFFNGILHAILSLIWMGIKIGFIALVGFGVGMALLNRNK